MLFKVSVTHVIITFRFNLSWTGCKVRDKLSYLNRNQSNAA